MCLIYPFMRSLQPKHKFLTEYREGVVMVMVLKPCLLIIGRYSMRAGGGCQEGMSSTSYGVT